MVSIQSNFEILQVEYTIQYQSNAGKYINQMGAYIFYFSLEQ